MSIDFLCNMTYTIAIIRLIENEKLECKDDYIQVFCFMSRRDMLCIAQWMLQGTLFGIANGKDIRLVI